MIIELPPGLQWVRRASGPGLAVFATLAAAACATTGSTLGSGVGDRFLERPPFYAGARTVPASAPIGHLPIRYQRGEAGSEVFDLRSGAGSPVAALVEEMNAYLDGLPVTRPIAAGQPVPGTPPDVQFGCVTEASGDCDRERRVDSDHRIRMRLAVGRPSGTWAAWARDAAEVAGAEQLLVVTLEVGQFWIRPEGWRNDKRVDLGTEHAVRLPWLTSLETPVSVLQLTGALVDRDGRAVRIGAEGLVARRTDLLASSFGLQRTISDRDVELLRTSRRDDLPGRPLVWEAALRNLVEQLTGAGPLAVR